MLLRYTLIFVLGMMISLFSMAQGFEPADLFRMEQVVEVAISPDGHFAAYTLNKERPFVEGKGADFRELHVMNLETGESRPYITGRHYMYSLKWVPGGEAISFLARMNGIRKTQVYQIPLNGGGHSEVTATGHSILGYAWHPEGKSIAYTTLVSDGESRDPGLVRMGFDAEIFEEGIKERKLFLYTLSSGESRLLNKEGAVYSFAWRPDGGAIAAQVAPQNLVDDSYMFKKIHLIDPATGEMTKMVDNPGKLTSMAWSPDGKHLAFVSAVDISDPVSGSLYVMPMDKPQEFKSLMNYSKDFEGSVNTVKWLDEENVIYSSAESVDATLRSQKIGKKKSKLLIEGGKAVFTGFSIANGTVVMSANHAQHPPEMYSYSVKGGEFVRRTTHNPWLAERKLGRQEKISYKAKDGLRVDGVLIYPTDYQEGRTYPMICMIHGGPEAHIPNGWYTYYSRWGQMAAARGFFVFMPNYRASSGRGVEYAKADHKDLAAAEFDDVLDGIDYLVEEGLVDRDRVGIGGGSYGGYFSAWAATKHSEHFAASVVFVGISNQISKRNCTDIPYEDYYVHWTIWTHEDPELVYDRSPVKWAKGSTTPTLILHGKKDTRVIPTQSLELYRQLKVHGEAPVRLVWYPGEGHGNRNNPAQLDYALRTLQWFEYYLKEGGPRDEMPPRELEYNIE